MTFSPFPSAISSERFALTRPLPASAVFSHSSRRPPFLQIPLVMDASFTPLPVLGALPISSFYVSFPSCLRLIPAASAPLNTSLLLLEITPEKPISPINVDEQYGNPPPVIAPRLMVCMLGSVAPSPSTELLTASPCNTRLYDPNCGPFAILLPWYRTWHRLKPSYS